MKRMAQTFLFAALLAAVALGLPRDAEAYDWSTVTVDAAGSVGRDTSIAVDASGDPIISYRDYTNASLKFGICDLSASANANCDQTSDWTTVTVDAGQPVWYTSIAVGASGDPMIAYYAGSGSLLFAICDLSESTNGNCDQTSDWTSVAVDPWDHTPRGAWPSIAVDVNGDPMISYQHTAPSPPDPSDPSLLKFATCDLSASANGNCDQASDWSRVTVESGNYEGMFSSIAVGASGDPMISYYDGYTADLKFATCDLSASVNANCDQAIDWTNVTVEAAGSVGRDTSIAVDASGDPMISYRDYGNEDLKFAICDLSASVNGNCDQTIDWSLVTVDAARSVSSDTSLALDAEGDPMISYYDDTNGDLRFAICDLSASAHANCDQTSDWSTEAVDAAGAVGLNTSIAVDADGDPIISYYDYTNADLKFAIGSPPSPPPTATAGIYRPSDGMWFLRNDNSDGVADLTFSYGAGISGGVPVVGDWDGDGDDTIGIYRSSDGMWFLRNTNTSGVADLTFSYGAGISGGVPVVGDWDGDGDDTIGIYRSSDGMWFLRNTNTSGVADLTFSYGAGISGGVPVVGDWDGDGDDTIGIHRASDGMWFLRNTNSSGVADLTFSYGAGVGGVPVVGDWDGDADDTIGIYRASDGMWFLRNDNTSGVADLTFSYGAGISGGVPVVGDWDGL